MQALLCIKYMLVHERTLPAKWCTRILLIRTTESEQTVFSCCPKVAAWRREALSKASNSITRNSNFRPCFQSNCVRAPIFMRRKRDLNCLVPQNRKRFTKWKLDRPEKVRSVNGIPWKLSIICHQTRILLFFYIIIFFCLLFVYILYSACNNKKYEIYELTIFLIIQSTFKIYSHNTVK